MYDVPDNQVVHLPCILHFMQSKPHIILSRDASCTLRKFDLPGYFLTRLGPVVADDFAYK